MDDEYEHCLCEYDGVGGFAVCTDCDYEINVSMFLLDVIEKLVDRYRKGERGYARAIAVSRARRPETAVRAAVTFDMLWPEGARDV